LSQIAKFASRFRDRALDNGRFSALGKKGLTIKDENYKGCDTFGYMDYVINQISRDCSIEKY
jgi:hypothetical protein